MFELLDVLACYWLPIIFIVSGAYLIGCINASIVVTKIFNVGEDIRNVGSGNAGFTNVLRTQGKKLAIWTFAIDFLKGVIAVLFAQMMIALFNVSGLDFPVLTFAKYLACLMCVIGHMYPCFFNFKGGKSILTTWAAMLFIDYKVFISLISVFLIVLIFKKIVSLASICAAISYPICCFVYACLDFKSFDNIHNVIIPTVFSSIISLLIIYRHKNNIIRLLNGSEKKISVKKEKL